ncbi:MAG: glycosyltransferase, partial [Xanthobacteraceae bacterium]|nr:glycosyltransferase [Xanthobacteraceae bacterium]
MAGPTPEQGAGARAADTGAPATGLSIVVPVFNEAAGLASLHGRLVDYARAITAKRGLSCEIVYVDDGSTDATHTIAAQLPASGVDVQIVSLSRNFGKEAALLAGL